jgi:hypothetical protein
MDALFRVDGATICGNFLTQESYEFVRNFLVSHPRQSEVEWQEAPAEKERKFALHWTAKEASSEVSRDILTDLLNLWRTLPNFHWFKDVDGLHIW